jgi:hypothetical protein
VAGVPRLAALAVLVVAAPGAAVATEAGGASAEAVGRWAAPAITAAPTPAVAPAVGLPAGTVPGGVAAVPGTATGPAATASPVTTVTEQRPPNQVARTVATAGTAQRAQAGPYDTPEFQILLTFIVVLLTISLLMSVVPYLLFRASTRATGPATAGTTSFFRWPRWTRTAAPARATQATETAEHCRMLIENATTLWRDVEAAVLDLKVGLPLRTLLLEELSHISRRLSRSPALQAAKSGALTTSEPEQYWKLLARDITRSIRDMNRIKAVAEAGRASFGTASNEPRMPATLEEAYFVLGANRNVDAETIQRLVRALRQCWHPDLAQSEEDRVYRQGRIRQINIANDIIRAEMTAGETA